VDERLFRLLYGAQGGSLTPVAAAFTILGAGWIVLALVPFFFFRRHRPWALALAGVFTVTAGAVAGLKLIVARVRPCNGIQGVSCLWGDAPRDFSFPSGHAAGSFAFAAFVLGVVFLSEETSPSRGAKALAALALVTAFFIALSRVYLGVHFPGDVFGGSCLGAAIGVIGARLYLRRARPGEFGATSSPPSPRSTRTRTRAPATPRG
jgi:undecaprenyl-diphosphatase